MIEASVHETKGRLGPKNVLKNSSLIFTILWHRSQWLIFIFKEQRYLRYERSGIQSNHPVIAINRVRLDSNRMEYVLRGRTFGKADVSWMNRGK